MPVDTPFPVPGFEVGIDLSAEALADLSSEGIRARLSSALDEMEDQREEIFGPDDETQSESNARRRSFDKKDYTVDEDDGFWGELREGILTLFGERASGTTHVEQSWGAGSFGAHIGYAPAFVGAPDPDKSYEENILEPGSGQLDHLIGWYSYWEMRVGKGLAELTAPVYEKPLWNDEGAVVEAPTLRAVVDFGVSVGALLTGNPWAIAAINLTDDALFGMMDLGAGDKDLGEVGLDLGREVLVGVATAGVGEIGGIAAELLSPVVGGAVGGAAGAVTWNEEDGWGWDSRVLAGRLVGREAFADYLGTTAGALISAGLGNGSSPNKFTAGASRLAAGLGEAATKWLYYLGAEASWNPDALDAGTLATRALDDMGGLTVNLANVGAIVDALMLVNEGQGGYSAEQYKALALAAQRLAGSGMLELSIGSTGARLALGGSGVDVGGGAYSLAKGTVVQALIAAYDGSDELKEAMRQAYASGDYAAEATIWRVMAGTDRIIEGAVSDALARTVSDSSGSRTIAVGEVAEGRWGALDAAVRLQHEGWRNGTAADGNDRETLDAALAHTRLARALGSRNAGYLEQTGGLLAEVRMLGYTEQTGDLSMFARSVASRYDSSADYWRLVSLEGGGHALEFDGRSDIYDEGWELSRRHGNKRCADCSLILPRRDHGRGRADHAELGDDA